MAQISGGNGFKADVPTSKGIVGKEEALRMEEEALAKLQKEKKSTVSPVSSSAASLSKPQLSKTSSALPQPSEKDLIVFPEARRPVDQDQFRDIDVDKLTNEELEKLLLDENFGAKSSVSRPSPLLSFNLSASYPGSASSSFQSAQWGAVRSTLGSGVSTPTHQPAPMFPSSFPQPSSFQNGFASSLPPYMALSGQQPPFVPFTPIQPAALGYPQRPVDPQMARLFHKIASTSEYLKNGRSSSVEPDSSTAGPASLAPNPPLQHPAGVESAGMDCFDWLDLDPLTRRKADPEEAPPVGADGLPAEVAGVDPWDAVLESKDDSSPSLKAKARPPHRRASTDAAVSGSPPLDTPASSAKQVGGVKRWRGGAKRLNYSC